MNTRLTDGERIHLNKELDSLMDGLEPVNMGEKTQYTSEYIKKMRLRAAAIMNALHIPLPDDGSGEEA